MPRFRPTVATRTEIGPAAEGRKEGVVSVDGSCVQGRVQSAVRCRCAAGMHCGKNQKEAARSVGDNARLSHEFGRISAFSPSVSRTKTFRTYLSQTVKSQSISENLINYYYYYDRGLYT